MSEEKNERHDIINGNSINNNEISAAGSEAGNGEDSGLNEIDCIKKELEEKSRMCAEYFEMLQRTAAEFDNYKKRVAKERENFRAEVMKDVIAAVLPVLDNLERAVRSAEQEEQLIKEGLELVLKQFKDILKELGVEEIKAQGEKFDPEIHSAMLHIQDESYGTNVVVEEMQKGYRMGDRIIRHSLVKVAN